MATRIVLRRDTAAAWTAANPVLLLGEPGYDETNHVLKVGDGITPWTSLPAPAGSSNGGGGLGLTDNGNGTATVTATGTSSITDNGDGTAAVAA